MKEEYYDKSYVFGEHAKMESDSKTKYPVLQAQSISNLWSLAVCNTVSCVNWPRWGQTLEQSTLYFKLEPFLTCGY